ncbi:MAG: helix-turn-helix domain-containing protein [Deinococcus sp.]
MEGVNVRVREAVRQALESRQLSSKELARELGMEPQNLSRMLTGSSGRVPENWEKILDALDLELVACPRQPSAAANVEPLTGAEPLPAAKPNRSGRREG